MHFSLGPIGSALLGFATLPFIAWFFSPEDVGRFNLVVVLFALSGSIIGLEAHQAYVREYHEVSDKESLLKTAMLPGFMMFGFFCLILFLSPLSVSGYLFEIPSALITSLMLLGMLINFVCNMLIHVLRMQSRGLVYSLVTVLPKFMFLSLVSLMLVLGSESSFEALLTINVVSIVCTCVVLFFFTKNTLILAASKKVELNLFVQMIKFCLPLIVGGITYWGLAMIDRFFVSKYSGLAELGIYSVAANFAGVVSVFTVLFTNIWHPLVYKWVKEGLKSEQIENVSQIMFLIIAILWSATGMLSWVLSYLLPDAYSGIEFIVIPLMSAAFLYLLSESTVVGIGASRKTSYAMLSSGIAFLVNVLLNYYLVPSYGAEGAAVATLLSFYIFFILRTEFSARLWVNFSRIKIYLFSSVYVFFTSWVCLSNINVKSTVYLWLLILGCVSVFFQKRYLHLLYLFKNKFLLNSSS